MAAKKKVTASKKKKTQKPARKTAKVLRKKPFSGKTAKIKKARGAKKTAKKKITKQELTGLKKIGKITHYFPHVKAAVLTISKGTLSPGDHIYIKGHTTNFKETITSMQINRVPIQQAKQGDEIGLLVKSRTRIGDTVYKI